MDSRPAVRIAQLAELPFRGTGLARWRAAVTAGEWSWLTNPITWHLAFWTIHALNELLIAVAERRALAGAGMSLVVIYSMLALPAYVNLFVFVPRLWRRGRRVASAIAATLFAAGTAWTFIVATRTGSFDWDDDFLRAQIRWTSTCVLYILSVAGLDMAARHVREMRLRAEREREEAERRLEHLRAQVNPHFLFNTLNSLYALAIVNSPDLPRLIVQHSELLRYALDHTRQPRVPLTSEIDFVAAYVAIERLRVEATDVRLDVDGVVRDQQIAPMLFAPLVENCFKHLAG
ncbi:MAG TPA: histidine kinase, partial [Thermoanaerobaculia bacterium]